MSSLKAISGKNSKDTKENKNFKPPNKGKPNTLGAQEFYNQVMNSVVQHINSELLPIKRDLEDNKLELRRLRMRNKELELEIKSMGIALSELGIVEGKIFNQMKNIVFDKISVVDRNGQIKGRNDIRRFNLTPISDKIMIQTKGIH